MPNQPAKNSPSVIVGDAFGALIESSPALKSRLHDIADKLLDKVEWDIDHGDPATVAHHMRAFLPLLAREAAANENDARMRQMEADIASMRQGFAGQFGHARPDDAPPASVAEDEPPR